MRRRGPFAPGVAEETGRRMRSAASREEYRRWQAVWLAAGEGRPNDDIARITGLAVSTVRVLHAQCRKFGLSALRDKPSGGRCRSNLTVAQERELLARFAGRTGTAEDFAVSDLQLEISRLVGKPVHLSGVYKMLARHGWRKSGAHPAGPHGGPVRPGPAAGPSGPRLPSR